MPDPTPAGEIREACRRCKGSGTEPRVGSLTARDLLYAERFTLNNVRRILAEGGVVTEEAVSTLLLADGGDFVDCPVHSGSDEPFGGEDA